MGFEEEKKEDLQQANQKKAESQQLVPAKDLEEKTKVTKLPDQKAIVTTEKLSETSCDRDVQLTRIEEGKKLALIRAWEENEKTKAQNKALKRLSAIESWENSRKAAVEAKLRKKEEEVEKAKAKCMEKMKNKAAAIHKAAEEKRAMVEAERGERLLKAEEAAEKFRATGKTPRRLLGCFS